MLNSPFARWSPPSRTGLSIDARVAHRLLTDATLKTSAALRRVDGRLNEMAWVIEAVRAGGFDVEQIPGVITAASPLIDDLPRVEKHLAMLEMWLDWPVAPGVLARGRR